MKRVTDVVSVVIQPRDTKSMQRGGVRRLLEARGGPMFAAFGRYLASRIDIVPFWLCEELAEIPDAAPPTSPEVVSSIFARETATTPDQAFFWFEQTPFDSRLFWQSHRAELGGVGLEVRVTHPSTFAWNSQAQDLFSVEPAFEEMGIRRSDFHEAVAEFQRQLVDCQSFDGDLLAFSLLEQDAKLFDSLAAPRLRRHLTTPHVLVTETSSELAPPYSVPSPEQARMLCFVWLRQALHGLVYPVEPSPRNIASTQEARILFTAGPFARLSEKTKTQLLKYLIAVAAQDADQAYSSLAATLSVHHNASEDEELRRQFRQTCHFRDGFGRLDDSAEHHHQPFSDEVLMHWRLAHGAAGVDSDLHPFFRGFFNVARTARILAPQRDSLLEALYDLRLLLIADEVKDLIRPAEVAGKLERYATAVLGMPEQLDRALTTLANGALRRGGVGPQPETRRTPSERYLFAASLLVAFAAIVMLLQRVEASARSPGLEFVIAVSIAALGLMLLRIGSRI